MNGFIALAQVTYRDGTVKALGVDKESTCTDYQLIADTLLGQAEVVCVRIFDPTLELHSIHYNGLAPV